MNNVLVFGNVTYSEVIVTLEQLYTTSRPSYTSSHAIGHKAFGRKLRSNDGDIVAALRSFAKSQELTPSAVRAVFIDHAVLDTFRDGDAAQLVKEAFPNADCHIASVYTTTT